MSWAKLLDGREIVPHTTSRQELQSIRALIARDLADAGIAALSADRRFATAYNAALQSATIAVACSGYRVSARAGHHAVTFEAAELAIGQTVATFTQYFDVCRRKRNTIEYHNASVASETEAAELARKAGEFHVLVEAWVLHHHSELVP